LAICAVCKPCGAFEGNTGRYVKKFTEVCGGKIRRSVKETLGDMKRNPADFLKGKKIGRYVKKICEVCVKEKFGDL
jgi:hypothetical protein